MMHVQSEDRRADELSGTSLLVREAEGICVAARQRSTTGQLKCPRSPSGAGKVKPSKTRAGDEGTRA
jgi:hypothetical protein